MAKRLVGMLASHTRFVEVFGGAGGVILTKPPSADEVWNDIDPDLYNYFRVLRDRRTRARLVEMIAYTPHGRRQFEECIDELAKGRSKGAVRRAWAFVVASNQGRNGCPSSPTDYAYSRSQTSCGMASTVAVWNKLPSRLATAGERLERVVIENLPFEQVFAKYDAPATMFLIDPPYLQQTRGRKVAYQYEFGDGDHERLLRIAQRLKGKCLICGYRHRLYDGMLTGWRRIDLTVPLRAGSRNGGPLPKRVESIWLNYEPPRGDGTARKALSDKA